MNTESAASRAELRRAAHVAVRNALRRGELTKGACAECGADSVLVEAHHADYAKPLEVEWLCKRCHARRTVLRGNVGGALAVLNDCIDRSAIFRHAQAEYCGLSAQQFSKLTSGVQRCPLDFLDTLPDDVVRDFLDRYPQVRFARVEPSTAPFADRPESPARDRALDRWRKS